jgi:SAM-dependent methyltransferase
MSAAQAGQLDTDAILDGERFLHWEHSALSSPMIDQVVGLVDRDGMRICDIGGGRGFVLNEIIHRCPHKLDATVMEVDAGYRDRLLNDGIRFVLKSILSDDIEEHAYDILIFRHVLHHLVGTSVRQTLANQRAMFGRMFRMLRPGGWLVFEEEYNAIRPFSRMVYYLSKWTNRWKIRLRAFEAGKVVVSFLTPGEIRSIIRENSAEHGLEVASESSRRWHMGLRWKLTLLMSNVGHVNYVIRKRR